MWSTFFVRHNHSSCKFNSALYIAEEEVNNNEEEPQTNENPYIINVQRSEFLRVLKQALPNLLIIIIRNQYLRTTAKNLLLPKTPCTYILYSLYFIFFFIINHSILIIHLNTTLWQTELNARCTLVFSRSGGTVPGRGYERRHWVLVWRIQIYINW